MYFLHIPFSLFLLFTLTFPGTKVRGGGGLFRRLAMPRRGLRLWNWWLWGGGNQTSNQISLSLASAWRLAGGGGWSRVGKMRIQG
jgi:hypothetical protein